jgi:hypothetical protein
MQKPLKDVMIVLSHGVTRLLPQKQLQQMTEGNSPKSGISTRSEALPMTLGELVISISYAPFPIDLRKMVVAA